MLNSVIKLMMIMCYGGPDLRQMVNTCHQERIKCQHGGWDTELELGIYMIIRYFTEFQNYSKSVSDYLEKPILGGVKFIINIFLFLLTLLFFHPHFKACNKCHFVL